MLNVILSKFLGIHELELTIKYNIYILCSIAIYQFKKSIN